MATATGNHLIAILASVVCLAAVCQSALISGASSDVSVSETERYQSRQRRDDNLRSVNSQEDRIEFLRAHNTFRREFAAWTEEAEPEAGGMTRMYWNAALEASVTDVARKCNLVHGQTRLIKQPKFLKLTRAYGAWIGQTIYRSVERPVPRLMMNAFATEMKDFTYKTGGGGDCIKVCGHYKQLVWEDSYLVGCGSARCDGYWISGCNYLPGGNIAEVQPYREGSACSLCSSSKLNFTECESQLCVPKDRCSPVKDCTVVDKENCLCAEDAYKKLVMDLLGNNAAINIRPTFASVISMTLLVVSVLNA